MNEPRFDVYTTDLDKRISRLFADLSLDAAHIISGMERDEFYRAIMEKGWASNSPAWTSFRPVVLMPRGDLLKIEQFAYLIELAG